MNEILREINFLKHFITHRDSYSCDKVKDGNNFYNNYYRPNQPKRPFETEQTVSKSRL